MGSTADPDMAPTPPEKPDTLEASTPTVAPEAGTPAVDPDGRAAAPGADARAVHDQRPRRDDDGFAGGVPGEEILEFSRIIAAVHAIDEESTSVEHLGAHGGEVRPREAPGTEVDPDLVEAAILHLEQRLANGAERPGDPATAADGR